MGLAQTFSKVQAIPGLHWLSPKAPEVLSPEECAGFLECQRLANRAVEEVGSMIREGWTESHAADLLNTYLLDSGVGGFFHRAFVWFGERTRYDGIRGYSSFAPSHRVIRPGEVFILDVAPILRGFTCDVGYTSCLGENAEWDRARAFLAALREDIPAFFHPEADGKTVCDAVDERIRQAGFDKIYDRYPFAVLGHRVHAGVTEVGRMGFLGFGWQSYWEFLSRGLFGQLLNANYRGSFDGLWAVEPHIGGTGFGAKFEELLLVKDGSARWLETRAERGK